MKRIKLGMILALMLASASLSAGPVNINSANAETLAKELNGIGLSRAQAIVDYRNQHGEFKSVDELANVKGIGESIVDKNRDNILLSGKPKSSN